MNCHHFDQNEAIDLSDFRRSLSESKEQVRKVVTQRHHQDTVLKISFSSEVSLLVNFDKMGRFDTLDVITIEDLLMFTDYIDNFNNGFRHFTDIGANLGLHSLFARNVGFTVDAYEPDPESFRILQANFALNGYDQIKESTSLHQMAVSNKASVQKFVRLKENPYGNHLEGLKTQVYGETLTVEVSVIDACRDLKLGNMSVIKIDAEGADSLIFDSLVSCFTRGQSTGFEMLLYLGDWRPESRQEIAQTIAQDGVIAFNRIDNKVITSEIDLPAIGTNGYVLCTLRSSN